LHAAHVSVSALQEQFQRAMFTTSILIFALIAVHAQAFALWVQSIRLTNNRISKSNYGDDITDAVPVFLFSALLFLRRSFLFFSFFLRSSSVLSAPTGTPYKISFRLNVSAVPSVFAEVFCSAKTF
jgi:hypothetical protein